jgi:hypothetical protein
MTPSTFTSHHFLTRLNIVENNAVVASPPIMAANLQQQTKMSL